MNSLTSIHSDQHVEVETLHICLNHKKDDILPY